MYGALGLQLVRGCLKEHEKETNKVSEWSVETILLQIHFSVLLLREGPHLMSTGGVGNTHSIRSTYENMGVFDGSSRWCAYRQV
jgi:hypothetical protein